MSRTDHLRRLRRARALRVAAACAAVLAIAGAIAMPTHTRAQVSPAGATAAGPLRAADAAAKYFPKSDSEAPHKRIFRLTRDQLDITVRTLLPKLRVKSVKTVMPKDPLQTNYEFAELLAFNDANIGPLTGWIGEIARAVAAAPRAVIDCEATDAPCLETAVQTFATKAFRGDVSNEKLDRLVAFHRGRVKAAGPGAAAAELVEAVFNSPDFLFRKEIDVNRRGRLSPAQALQALTYTLADAPPERLAIDSREAIRHVQTEDDLQATVDAIFATDDARAKLSRFFKAWLELKAPDEFTISRATFPEFTPQAASAAVAEATAFLDRQLALPRPSLKDITIAPLPGTDPKQRLGIFSHPALLTSHSGPTDTRLVKRGVFWVRKVMCMELEPPPKGLDIKLYEAAATTERDRIEQATGRKACIGCHRLIDPFGFFLENYDALGRWRTTDNGHPIDAAIDVDFLDEGPAKATSPVEALKLFTGSAMFKQCFVRQLFRFYMGRHEEASDDPVLQRMFVEFAADDRQDILKALETLAASDRTSRRW